METITHKGLTFEVRTEQDHCIGKPWQEFDCHGEVREESTLGFRQVNKAPGEVVIYSDRGRVFLYDYQGTIKRAHAEGWGLSGKPLLALNARLKRVPTRREVVAEAVRLDMERMRGWCEDRWGYVCLVVELLDIEGKRTGLSEVLGGLESDDHEHIEEEAQRLAEELAAQVGAVDVLWSISFSLTKHQRIRAAEAV